MFALLMPGPTETLLILFIALLVFGNRLPTVMRSLGSSVNEFKKGLNEVGDAPVAVAPVAPAPMAAPAPAPIPVPHAPVVDKQMP